MDEDKYTQDLTTTPPTRQDFLKDIISQFISRRHALGLTQEDIDYRMGNADRLCSKWECGLRIPTPFNFYCWAETLSVKIRIEQIN